ncbi:MAG: InlB B-repeat-containing protein [Acetatifactor sp.]|nr:InlB B-repeat-containing protein [Acetatifactor sp.]
MPTHIENGKAIISFESEPMAKVRVGEQLVYYNPAGAVVTYYVDSDVVYKEKVDAGENVLHPKTFTPSKDGWDFVGWRIDNTANGDVLEELIMGDDEPITLYAVFRQEVILSYNANGGKGSTKEQNGNRYYNGAGTYADASFIISSNNFSKSGYSFLQWRLNNTSGAIYAPGSIITLSTNAILYAEWVGTPYTLTLSTSGWTGPTKIRGSMVNMQIVYLGNEPALGGTGSSGGIDIANITRNIDTHGCKYVDFTTSKNINIYGGIFIGGKALSYTDKAGTNINITQNTKYTVELDTSKDIQELEMRLFAGTGTHNYVAIQPNLYFHN